MGKARRKTRQVQPDSSVKTPSPPRYDGPAKIGPRMVLAEEEFAEPGTAHSQKRLRNHGEHPLTLALHRGQLVSKYPAEIPEQERITAHERFAAGEEYRANYERMFRSGRDSTDMSTAGGGSGTPWSQAMADSIRWISKIEGKMHRRDMVVIRKFCGEGETMVEALRSARILFHPDAAAWRVREALDDLVTAITGRRVTHTSHNVP